MSRRKTSIHPFDTKTGRLVFTPVLRSTGECLDLIIVSMTVDGLRTTPVS